MIGEGKQEKNQSKGMSVRASPRGPSHGLLLPQSPPVSRFATSVPYAAGPRRWARETVHKGDVYPPGCDSLVPREILSAKPSFSPALGKPWELPGTPLLHTCHLPIGRKPLFPLPRVSGCSVSPASWGRQLLRPHGATRFSCSRGAGDVETAGGPSRRRLFAGQLCCCRGKAFSFPGPPCRRARGGTAPPPLRLSWA